MSTEQLNGHLQLLQRLTGRALNYVAAVRLLYVSWPCTGQHGGAYMGPTRSNRPADCLLAMSNQL
jgi:hypothetical protein